MRFPSSPEALRAGACVLIHCFNNGILIYSFFLIELFLCCSQEYITYRTTTTTSMMVFGNQNQVNSKRTAIRRLLEIFSHAAGEEAIVS